MTNWRIQHCRATACFCTICLLCTITALHTSLVAWSTTLLHLGLVKLVIHVQEKFYTDYILGSHLWHLTIQRHHVQLISIQFAMKPRESLVIMFVLSLPLLKGHVWHLSLLACTSATRFADEMIMLQHFVRPTKYWTTITTYMSGFPITNCYNWPWNIPPEFHLSFSQSRKTNLKISLSFFFLSSFFSLTHIHTY